MPVVWFCEIYTNRGGRLGLVWFVEIFTNRWRRPLKIATLLPQNAAAVVLPTFNIRPRGFDYNLGHCETCHAMVDRWFWHLLAEVKEEDYKMEKVDGAELAVEDEIVDGVSVPKYVHPNTHISGFYSNTHTHVHIRSSWNSFGYLSFSLSFILFASLPYLNIQREILVHCPRSSQQIYNFKFFLSRYSLFADHLHLRDDHVPLRILCFLLERKDGGGGRREARSERWRRGGSRRGLMGERRNQGWRSRTRITWKREM